MAACNKCYEDGLKWVKTQKGWRLSGGLNVCRDTNIHQCIDTSEVMPDMSIKNPSMTKRGIMAYEDQQQYDGYVSRMNQCPNERIKIMVLGDNYERI